MRRFLVLVLAALALSVVLGVAFVAFARHDSQPFVSAVDGLQLPTTWKVVSTEVMSQGGTPGCIELIDLQCPRVTRYLDAAGDLRDVLEQARAAAAAAGFTNVAIRHPDCVTPTPAVVGVIDSPTCGLSADKPGMVVYVDVYPAGAWVDGIKGLNGSLPTVRIIATRG